jgi:hypothetical protein
MIAHLLIGYVVTTLVVAVVSGYVRARWPGLALDDTCPPAIAAPLWPVLAPIGLTLLVTNQLGRLGAFLAGDK